MRNRAQTSKRQPKTNTGQHKPFHQRSKKFQGQKNWQPIRFLYFLKSKYWEIFIG